MSVPKTAAVASVAFMAWDARAEPAVSPFRRIGCGRPPRAPVVGATISTIRSPAAPRQNPFWRRSVRRSASTVSQYRRASSAVSSACENTARSAVRASSAPAGVANAVASSLRVSVRDAARPVSTAASTYSSQPPAIRAAEVPVRRRDRRRAAFVADHDEEGTEGQGEHEQRDARDPQRRPEPREVEAGGVLGGALLAGVLLCGVRRHDLFDGVGAHLGDVLGIALLGHIQARRLGVLRRHVHGRPIARRPTAPRSTR